VLFLAALAAPTAVIGADVESGIREVTMTDRSLVSLATRQRFFTDIHLPPDDLIKDVACGDPTYWVVEWADNVVRVKPAKKGATTNLGVRMASGRSYTFKLAEGTGAPDFKVFVASGTKMPEPRFVPVSDYEALQATIAGLEAALDRERKSADERVAAFQQRYPGSLRFDFRAAKYEAPFLVSAIWHDGRFTYLRSEARELPALYELVDGQPSLVNFTVADGTYVVPKVLDRGYLALGKKRWVFARR
jgi:type IV secretory pathway VirB9-like protein